jgi:hypothetical protein
LSDNLAFLLAIVLGEILPATIMLYAAYWAFEIRKALASPIRRNMALWQGSATLIAAATIFVTYSNSFVLLLLEAAFYDVAFVVIFAFLDSLLKVTRRSDPLLRDIIHWQQTRYIGWAAVALTAAFNPLYAFFPQSNAVPILVDIFNAVIFVVGGAGVLVGAPRIKDPVLKGNLKWIGLGLLCVIAVISTDIVESAAGLSNYTVYYSYPALILGLFFGLTGYCFYRAARHLAPISRLTEKAVSL